MPIGNYKHHSHQGFQKGHKPLVDMTDNKNCLGKHWKVKNSSKMGHKVGIKLSDKTKQIMSKNRIGILNPNWKGGIDLENKRIKKSLEYTIWRKEVYERDKWTCRLCGYKGNKIVAHHLKLFSKFPELRFAIDNGLTICRSCHAKIHKPALK